MTRNDQLVSPVRPATRFAQYRATRAQRSPAATGTDLTGPDLSGTGVGSLDLEIASSQRWWTLKTALRQPLFVVSVAWIFVVLLAALVPSLLTVHDPYTMDPYLALTPASGEHWFGTDEFGRDLYTRVVYGTSESIKAAVFAVLIGLVAGSIVGVVSGYVGGVVDTVIMRIVDTLLSIPSLILSLAILTILGRGTIAIAIAIGVGSIAGTARLMRSEVLGVKGRAYVEASRFSGHGVVHRLRRHVVPNSSRSVVNAAILDTGSAILAVASLSFLGLGAPPPTPEWGALVAAGRSFFPGQWWLSILPGFVVAATVLSVYKIARVLGNSRSTNIA